MSETNDMNIEALPVPSEQPARRKNKKMSALLKTAVAANIPSPLSQQESQPEDTRRVIQPRKDVYKQPVINKEREECIEDYEAVDEAVDEAIDEAVDESVNEGVDESVNEGVDVNQFPGCPGCYHCNWTGYPLDTTQYCEKNYYIRSEY